MVEALVAGHICLDIIPAFAGKVAFDPGRLIEVGPAQMSTGGAVSNTGQALHKLGIKTGLCGKVADDLFGKAICEILEGTGEGLSRGMRLASGEASSYSVVISLTGEDRMFLHAPGCNDTFVSADVSDEALADTKLLHFGYPTLMAQMFASDGVELELLLRRAKEAGVTTSLDVSLPDLAGNAGRADWLRILTRCLPMTDLFMPNVEELQFMLNPAGFAQSRGQNVSVSEIRALARAALDLGAKVVCVKAGSRGFYLLTRNELKDLGRATAADLAAWEGVEIWAPCFSVEVRGTTGAGDATIAGFLMAWLRGMLPIDAVKAATAVGACCCERHDAVTGVQSWAITEQRIAAGWSTVSPELGSDWSATDGVFVSR